MLCRHSSGNHADLGLQPALKRTVLCSQHPYTRPTPHQSHTSHGILGLCARPHTQSFGRTLGHVGRLDHAGCCRRHRWSVPKSSKQNHLSAHRGGLGIQLCHRRICRTGLSLLATFVGFCCLFFLHLIGGMGAGDVKLLAGIAAFVGIQHTLWIFCVPTIIGGIIAVCRSLYSVSGEALRTRPSHPARDQHGSRCDKLYEIAQARKSSMLLLPYGIPMTIAAIGYFACLACSKIC